MPFLLFYSLFLLLFTLSAFLFPSRSSSPVPIPRLSHPPTLRSRIWLLEICRRDWHKFPLFSTILAQPSFPSTLITLILPRRVAFVNTLTIRGSKSHINSTFLLSCRPFAHLVRLLPDPSRLPSILIYQSAHLHSWGVLHLAASPLNTRRHSNLGKAHSTITWPFSPG